MLNIWGTWFEKHWSSSVRGHIQRYFKSETDQEWTVPVRLFQPVLFKVNVFIFIYFLIFKRLFIIERQRETEHWHGRGKERRWHGIQSGLQAPSCQHREWCGARTHKPWDHGRSWSLMLNRLSHSDTPIYFERGGEEESGTGRERGRHRIWSRLQALSCQHRAWCGARTHKPWDHDLSRSWTLNQLSHPGAPHLPL